MMLWYLLAPLFDLQATETNSIFKSGATSTCCWGG